MNAVARCLHEVCHPNGWTWRAWWPSLVVVILLGGAAWALWDDTQPPIESYYQHPRFLTCPAETRAQAAACEATHAPVGAVLWRYEEYCDTGQRRGIVARVWTSPRGRVWQSDQIPTLSRAGCATRVFLVTVPRWPGLWTMTQRIEWHGRVLSALVEYPPIEIEVIP